MRSSPTIKPHQQLELHAHGLNQHGQGVARLDGDGLVVFVDGLLPGETALCRIRDVRSNYAVADLIQLTTPSPDRVQPFCNLYESCGGCALQHLDYSAQLALKRQTVRDALIRIGGFAPDLVEGIVQPTAGMEDPLHYRNKVQFPVGPSLPVSSAARAGSDSPRTVTDPGTSAVTAATRRSSTPPADHCSSAFSTATRRSSTPPATHPGPGPQIGFYQRGSHDICDGDRCDIGHPAADLVRALTRRHMADHNIPAYDEQTGRGLVRHIMVRAGFTTGQIMVCLVLTSPDLPAQDSWLSSLNTAIREAGLQLASVWLNINRRRGNRILGDRFIKLHGADHIEDVLLGIRYRISPASFFQVNPHQTEVLYTKALDAASLRPIDTVFDLYCGTGSISLALAQRCQRVIGNEIVEAAVEDARANALANGIINAEFYAGKAEEVIPRLYAEGARADCVVVDPPRKGCDSRLLKTIIDMAPSRLVYVSCDPATLARDLRILADGGFVLRSVEPVDMFPWSTHVETVVSMVKP